MKRTNLKSTLKLFLIVLFAGFTFISFVVAEDLTQQAKITPVVQESKDSTRIVITTSGPAKFTSYWLDNPARLVVDFQTKNVVSKIGSELLVSEGVIKRITSQYYDSGQKKTLRSLTFELYEKVPYEIWQEAGTIILDIQSPLEVPLSSEADKEVFTKSEPKEVAIKRQAAMEAALKQIKQSPSALTAAQLTKAPSIVKSRNQSGMSFWLIGLSLVGGCGALAGWFWYKNTTRRQKFIDSELVKLKAKLQEKDKFIEQKEQIYKAVEQASRQKEKEHEQLMLELNEKERLIEQEEKAKKSVEEKLSQKTKEFQEVKDSFESLKEVLIKKGEVKELTTPEEKGKLWIRAKSPERRSFARLDLSRDYNKTIILRIETEDKSKSIKSFANNIGLGGLCFETRSAFKEKETLNLRLFFFGDKVPMLRIKAVVGWVKTAQPVNIYGLFFVSLEEKDKAELNRYIESKILK